MKTQQEFFQEFLDFWDFRFFPDVDAARSTVASFAGQPDHPECLDIIASSATEEEASFRLADFMDEYLAAQGNAAGLGSDYSAKVAS